MQLVTLLLLHGLLYPLIASCYSEHLDAAQLIGSHFGMIDIPVTYDYVIVGGGTAGLVMARNLALNSSFTVAVIEAGGFSEFDNGNRSEVPAFSSQSTRRYSSIPADEAGDLQLSTGLLLPLDMQLESIANVNWRKLLHRLQGTR